MSKLKVMIIFGTRPEAIKMAPLVKKLKEERTIETKVVITAQHREMLDQVLELFKITPDFDLDIMTSVQSLTDITINVLEGLEEIICEETPDIILVHGDTSTTFVGALASFYQEVKIGHVEAGLRTHDKYSPYPEEINRQLTGVLADLHFAPTVTAKQNLLHENVSEADIFVTGNTVIDALLETVEDNYQFNDFKLNQVDFNNKKVVLLTSHRRENLGAPMENIFEAVKEIVINNQNVEVVFPIHLNPKVRKIAKKKLTNINGVHLIEPLDYQPFVNLMDKSYLVLTDSGGIQEEAPSLGKPVLVLRDTTERPEAVQAGTVKLVGTNKEKIVSEIQQLINNSNEYNKMAKAVNPYGDGHSSQRIMKKIIKRFDK